MMTFNGYLFFQLEYEFENSNVIRKKIKTNIELLLIKILTHHE